MYSKRQDILVFKIISENKNLPRNIQLLIFFSDVYSIVYRISVKEEKRKGMEKFQ